MGTKSQKRFNFYFKNIAAILVFLFFSSIALLTTIGYFTTKKEDEEYLKQIETDNIILMNSVLTKDKRIINMVNLGIFFMSYDLENGDLVAFRPEGNSKDNINNMLSKNDFTDFFNSSIKNKEIRVKYSNFKELEIMSNSNGWLSLGDSFAYRFLPIMKSFLNKLKEYTSYSNILKRNFCVISAKKDIIRLDLYVKGESGKYETISFDFFIGIAGFPDSKKTLNHIMYRIFTEN